MRGNKLPLSIKVAWGFRSATIICAQAMRPRPPVSNMFHTLPRCLRWQASPTIKHLPTHKKSWISRPSLAKVSIDVTSQRDPNKIYHLESIEQLSRAGSCH